MTASQQDAGVEQEASELRAGMVRIELVPASLPWRGSMEEAVLRRRGQYIAGVEYLARALDAAEPLVWEEDATLLVLTGTSAAKLPARVLEAARELWARIRVELGLSARIAAHVGKARAGAEAGAFGGADVTRCRQLAAQAPADRVVLTEDLALALPEQTQRELAMLGRLEGEEGLVYAFPADRALAGTASFVFGEAEIRREKLRAYAGGPDVRLIRYVGFRLHRKEPPRLDVRHVFIPSEVELRRHAEIARPAALPRQAMEAALSPWEPRATADPGGPPLPFGDVFARHRSLVVLGDPGSGKTTLLRWLAVIAATGRFELETELGVPERLLPIPVSVGRLAEIRRTLGDGGVSVPEALARYLHDRSLGDAAEIRAALERDLTAGHCLVLLDGLDEVKAEERDAVRDWLQAFAAANPRNRFVVSSRRYGYTGIELPGGAVEVVLRPFNDAQVERYVRAFHRAYVRWESGSEPATAADADRLLEALRASPRLSSLARNPFMLSALALIHRAEGRLPRHRVQAYEIFARALCETWAEARRLVAGRTGGPVIEYEEEALPILGELALAMHEQHPTGVAPEEFVVDQIAGALERHRGLARQPARRAAEGFLRRAAEEVQILLERGAGEWGFLHLTFQEFFVAAGLHATERFEEEAMRHLFDPHWEEVVRLGVGYMALVQKRPRAAQRFVERVLDYEAPEPRSWVTSVMGARIPLAALLAAEAGDVLPISLQERVADALAKWVETASQGDREAGRREGSA